MSQKLQYQQIADKLGLRAPWRLLDFAVKSDDTHFAGFKNFTVNEAFFAGHFPIHPIVPGVLQMETVRQLCLCFLPGNAADYRVVKMEKIKFRRQVLPGDRMRVDAELVSSENGEFTFKAVCSTVSGNCSEGVMVFGAADELNGLQDIPALDGEYPRTAEIAMDTDKVMKLMPHRYPFLQIDYVAVAADGKVVAVKNISANEHYIDAGLGFVPETLMCEIAAQSGCASVLSRPENAGKLGFFMAIEKGIFHRRIVPGEQMLIEIDLPPSKSRFGKGSGVIRVGSEVVAEIALMFALVDAE